MYNIKLLNSNFADGDTNNNQIMTSNNKAVISNTKLISIILNDHNKHTKNKLNKLNKLSETKVKFLYQCLFQ